MNSGFPDGITKSEYLSGWDEREGLAIVEEEIVHNPSKRIVAKLLLNRCGPFLFLVLHRAGSRINLI